jgi:hypothetical protein
VQSERRKEHNCSLCCGSTCQLCGEKCLKYEPPSLNCQQCGTRIKKNGIFYVCGDGSALWCQKCYISLPPVIVAGAPRPLHNDEGAATGGADAHEPTSASISSSALVTSEDAGALAVAQEGDVPCAISLCDSDSLHDGGAHTETLHDGRHPTAVSVGSVRDRDSSSYNSHGGDDAPLLKRHLLKRRADEEVAEPWVACDSCGNWYHQICALYSKLGDASTTKSFSCPFCVLLASDGADLEQNLLGVVRGTAPCRSRSSVGAACRSRSSWGSAEELIEVGTCESTHMDVSEPRDNSLALSLPESVPASLAVAGSRLNRGLSVKFEAEDTLFQNIFEYSDLSAPHSLACTPRNTNGRPDVERFSLADTVASDAMILVDNSGVAFVSANSSCAGTGLTSEDERLLDDDASLHGGCSGAEESVMEVCAVPSSAHTTRGAASTPVVEPAPAPEVPASGSPLALAPSAAALALDTHWKWRASSLPHTQLGDFLQALIQDLLVANGYPDAADTVTIRMTTNKDMPLDVPASVVQNLVSPSGHVIPECLGYKQKCILLFQEIDGVDVCIFSLYVHEFDARCPSPNTSTVYIAYLDSVDYFRPVAARTMVYQEIVAGYLKWSQMRGFKAAHIWSCPPHRGDNFIFNSHPAHQKYPSRDRLNQWYKSMLQRCSRLGIIAETGNLWQQYFSKYVRRDALPVARQAALNSFVGSGKALRKTNAKPKAKAAGAAKAAAAGGADLDGSNAMTAPVENAAASVETIVAVAPAAPSAPAASPDAPVCPPIFDGDYWVQQYVYLVRLHTQRGKHPGTAAQRQQLGVRKLRELLKRLMNREESDPFLHPVDHIALDIPNYTLIVKQPMDFSTVKEKLNAGEYPTAVELVKVRN